MQSLFYVFVGVCIVLLFVALFVALKRQKRAKKEVESLKIPSAEELLELLENKNNDLKKLESLVSLAKAHFRQYTQEISDFDLKVIAILSAHKGVNTKLILDTEKHFSSLNPTRKELLSKALSIGLSNR
ncbi:MAG: hypothetical protein SOW25_01515 [Helicobacter sp.]|nr:hypothetical protein [Helicobacteraceae bacterium]MDY3112989.1 hypothetical protein [Helicobacter sp.]